MTQKKDWKKKRRFRQKLAGILQRLLHKPLLLPPYGGPLRSVVILAQEKFGDAILLTPLLGQLKRYFPQCTLHVVTFSKATCDFFQDDRNIDHLHIVKGNAWRYYRKILGQRFDMLFNTKDHPSTNFLLQSLLIRAEKKAGIDSPYHRGIYDYLVDLDFHTPIALKNCGLVTLLGKKTELAECRPYIPEKTVTGNMRLFLDALPPGTCIGLNISAGGPTRYWTEENWISLADAFPEERFLVFSAPDDRHIKKRIEHSCPNIDTAPETANLYEAALLAAKLKLLVTPDTAMVHVASCVNIPVLGLYGKAGQDLSRFGPFLVEHRIIASLTALVRDIPAETVIATMKEMGIN